MIPNKARNLIIGLFLVTMLLVGFNMTTAQAQQRIVLRPRPVVVYRYRPFFGSRWGYDPFWSRTVTVVDPIAQQRESGYSDGHSRGRDDAKHNKPEAPASHKHYSDSHSLTYREAFLEGYADGYNEQMGRVG